MVRFICNDPVIGLVIEVDRRLTAINLIIIAYLFSNVSTEDGFMCGLSAISFSFLVDVDF